MRCPYLLFCYCTIDSRGLNFDMAQQLLHLLDRHAHPQQIRGRRPPKPVRMHFAYPRCTPNLFKIFLMPDFVRRLCGARVPTNKAGLSSVLLSRYSFKCRCARALRYTSRSLLPFPSTITSSDSQHISSRFNRHNSDTLTALEYKNSTIARSRSCSQARRTFPVLRAIAAS